ncbi:shikimate 5-dehydrogenase [Arsenicicoccus piscis]|uniref:Shikimate 5-dehydrogenase n=1 Tax=Arsenicicoccus piscis TaxID=673954 RepID=A0ABQ6HRK9_9MICO|nr:shikimate 5-dehydrogenase [Arsenicicoccus piscis]MCH8628767.1 shikimate 5-dehydrogenase [Arsenicicoccus piscis]GMA20190.1 shikimate 5-dehydrogenase [Arsenicicoccus piscis]
MRTIAGDLTKDTTLCLSLSGRPGNTGTRFHNYLYDALGLDYVYKAFTTTDIVAAIAGVRGLGIRGAAISMPWKEDVIPLVDELDPSAEAIESVNTIVNTDGRLVAYNTDYIAIATLLRDNEIDRSSSVAVLGSGGMAKATVAALRDGGYADVTVVARNASSGGALAERYGFDRVAELGDARPQVVINCTPVGMAGGPQADALPVADEVVTAADVVFDVVPMPEITPLLARAAELGKVTITGASVMSLQALEQFVLYTGVRPSPELAAEATAYSRA